MPKTPKPYFRKYTQSWYCSHKGKQISLGKDKKAAQRKFDEIMGSSGTILEQTETVYNLSQVYLDWVQENRSKSLFDNHLRCLKSLIEQIGRRMKIHDLKRRHVLDWSLAMGNPTSQNDAISVVVRMFNWAIEKEYVLQSPIRGIKKPSRKRREIVYNEEQWESIREVATGPLIPFLDFLWSTGCRPKEARTLEARHLHGDLVIFPPDESKGERDSRVIFLTERSKTILEPFLDREGPLFLNSRGVPWTKDAIVQRLKRISNKVGFRCIAYGTRHSFATNALIRSVDAVSLSHLMGHKSTRMINTYAHLSQNMEFLQKQAKVASGT